MEPHLINLKLDAPWEEVKERIKENDSRITDADLEYETGKEEELLERLGKIMNKPHDEVVAYIESISANKDLSA